MPAPAVTDITMRNAKAYFGKMATTNLYQVFISDGWQGTFTNQLRIEKGIDFKNFGTTLGLMCTDASIPASTYATAEVKDNFMGVTQEFAHTRIYTDIDFTFYIDYDYQVLKFFEFWMNYVSGGGPAQTAAGNSFRRFNYPHYYKNSQVYIKKFERDYLQTNGARSINYQLINAFPKSVTSIPVSYGPTDLLKITVTMNYDRYLYGEETSLVPSGNSESPVTETSVTETPVTQTQEAQTSPPNRPRTRNEVITGGFIR